MDIEYLRKKLFNREYSVLELRYELVKLNMQYIDNSQNLRYFIDSGSIVITDVEGKEAIQLGLEMVEDHKDIDKIIVKILFVNDIKVGVLDMSEKIQNDNLYKVKNGLPEVNLGDFIKYVDEIAGDNKIIKAEVLQIYVNKFKDDIVLLVDNFSRGFERTQYIPLTWVRAVYRDIWDMED